MVKNTKKKYEFSWNVFKIWVIRIESTDSAGSINDALTFFKDPISGKTLFYKKLVRMLLSY